MNYPNLNIYIYIYIIADFANHDKHPTGLEFLSNELIQQQTLLFNLKASHKTMEVYKLHSGLKHKTKLARINRRPHPPLFLFPSMQYSRPIHMLHLMLQNKNKQH